MIKKIFLLGFSICLILPYASWATPTLPPTDPEDTPTPTQTPDTPTPTQTETTTNIQS